jgi:hypothetical protein
MSERGACPDSFPGLGLTMRVRMRSWQVAAALGLLPGIALDDQSGQASCLHDGSAPLCGRCCWAYGLL